MEEIEKEHNSENKSDDSIKNNNKNLTLKIFEFFENIGIWILEKIHLKKLADLYKEHIEGMRYLICGGLSTVVNIVAYALGANILFLGIQNDLLRVSVSDIFAFIVALIFAYWVNKTIVFDSKCENIKALLKEIASFTSCRIFTEIISLGMMRLSVIIGMNELIMKILANIVVIVLNFVLSKLIIFKKKN